MLAALDVFSGIGGFARALQGIATIKRFCDIDSAARACLQKNMDKGLLEKAEIETDIRHLKGSKDIDLIAAGIPCLGFSPLGLEQGRLRARPDEGLRWFCLARKPGLDLSWEGLRFVPHRFDTEDAPPRVIGQEDPGWVERAKRCFLLGNSIVPCVARLAFFLLASGFRQGDISAPTLVMGEPNPALCTVVDETHPGFYFPKWGGVDSCSVYSIPIMHFKRPELQLRLLQKPKLEVLLTDKVNIAPRCIKETGPTSFAAKLRNVADEAKSSKSAGKVDRVVVIVDGTGASECGSAALKALGQLFSLEDCSLLDVVSTILLINADETLKAA
ncbi:hypothetical protein KFL_004530030 [Klebsormidium nitens]|uniref:DNA (cytosine-5-)-methyltransferase n=1 Tax=Klebsormidium nitens TaxID=105231 RepID=A0A1Y1ICP9_KLENI|nr:hypothetical protein KFL_004530030 [Klebsormidium nitens]|eukprot:GAQ88700.1 hypothetical protein KFL_004530030 [Klebsormidium nitens]